MARILMGSLGSPTVLSCAVLLLFLLPCSFGAFCVHKSAFVKVMCVLATTALPKLEKLLDQS